MASKVGVVNVEAPSADGGTVEEGSPATAAGEVPIDGVAVGDVGVRWFRHLPKAGYAGLAIRDTQRMHLAFGPLHVQHLPSAILLLLLFLLLLLTLIIIVVHILFRNKAIQG